MASLRSLLERLHALVRESVAFDRAGLSRKRATVLFTIRLFIQVWKGLVADKCLQQASSLAYKSVLSLVPSVAVALSVVKAFGGFEGSESAVVVFLSRHLLAVSPDTVAEYVTRYTDQLSFGAIGGVGVAVLFIVAVSLLDTVDRTLNDIWRSKVRRGWVARFTTFYAVITLGPVLLTLSLYQTARLHSVLGGAVSGGPFPYLLPTMVTWAVLLLCYKLFPTARVKWTRAMAGAAVAAVGFEAVKYGFNVYVAELLLSSYNRIYGAMALVPLFLVWVYVVWIIVLFGAELAFTLDNLGRLVHDEEEARFAKLGGFERHAIVNEFLAIRVAVAVARRWDGGEGGATADEVRAGLALPHGAAAETLGRLVAAGFLLELDSADTPVFLPARPLRRIPLAALAAAFRERHLDSGRVRPDGPMEASLEAAERALRDSLKDTTLADLVEPGPSGSPAPSGSSAPVAP